jgi:hypothetical protein
MFIAGDQTPTAAGWKEFLAKRSLDPFSRGADVTGGFYLTRLKSRPQNAERRSLRRRGGDAIGALEWRERCELNIPSRRIM